MTSKEWADAIAEWQGIGLDGISILPIPHCDTCYKIIAALAAAERSDAIHLEALAESERLRELSEKALASYVESVKFAAEHNERWQARAEEAEAEVKALREQFRLAIISDATNEGEANDLRILAGRMRQVILRQNINSYDDRDMFDVLRDLSTALGEIPKEAIHE